MVAEEPRGTLPFITKVSAPQAGVKPRIGTLNEAFYVGTEKSLELELGRHTPGSV